MSAKSLSDIRFIGQTNGGAVNGTHTEASPGFVASRLFVDCINQQFIEVDKGVVREMFSGLKEGRFGYAAKPIIYPMEGREKVIQLDLTGMLSQVEQIQHQGWEIEAAFAGKCLWIEAVFCAEGLIVNRLVYAGIDIPK
jgi:hypothetical protein